MVIYSLTFIDATSKKQMGKAKEKKNSILNTSKGECSHHVKNCKSKLNMVPLDDVLSTGSYNGAAEGANHITWLEFPIIRSHFVFLPPSLQAFLLLRKDELNVVL